MRTMTKRFYNSSSAVMRPEMLTLYGDAIERARKQLDNNPHLEEVNIVEIVAVVRREKTPIVVEKIRRTN